MGRDRLRAFPWDARQRQREFERSGMDPALNETECDDPGLIVRAGYVAVGGWASAVGTSCRAGEIGGFGVEMFVPPRVLILSIVATPDQAMLAAGA